MISRFRYFLILTFLLVASPMRAQHSAHKKKPLHQSSQIKMLQKAVLEKASHFDEEGEESEAGDSNYPKFEPIPVFQAEVSCLVSIGEGLKAFEGLRHELHKFRELHAPDEARINKEYTNYVSSKVSLSQSELARAWAVIAHFRTKIEKADGDNFHKSSQQICDTPNPNPPTVEQTLEFLKGGKSNEALVVLRTSARWGQLKKPSKHDVPVFQQSTDYDAESHQKLQRDEYASLQSYTGSGYGDYNTFLRTKPTVDGPEKERLKGGTELINFSLGRLDNFVGTVKRGTDLPETVRAMHKKGAVVTYDAFTSTSVTKAFGGEDQFFIKSYTGKHVATYSSLEGEDEVLFRSGTKFKVLDVVTQKGKNIYYLEEIFDDGPRLSSSDL